MKITQLVILSLSFIAQTVSATECGVMQFKADKSRGVQVLKNNCQNNRGVSLGTDFKLLPGARLWLKSGANTDAGRHFEVICQNRSQTPVSINVSTMFIPWIDPTGLNNCSGWIDNKLICDDLQGNHQRFYCVIAAIAEPDYSTTRTIERTTSVKLRKINPGSQQPVTMQVVAPALTPEIELCRDLYEMTLPVTVKWFFDTSGHVLEADVDFENFDKQPLFADCVQTVVKTFAYPLISQRHSYTYRY